MKKNHTSQVKVLCFLLSVVLIGTALAALTFRQSVVAKESTIGITPTVKDCKLELKPRGEYNMAGFGEEFFVYHFDEPNADIVVYCISNSSYLVGEDASKTGVSYADAFMIDSQFIALSDKYLLFITSEGMIAVSFEENSYEKIRNGEPRYRYIEYSFDDLPEEEQASFIYPTSYEKVLQFKGNTSSM